MSAPGDGPVEMPRNPFPDDRDVESLLAGRAADPEWSGVASLLQEIGSGAAAAPVRIGSELAQVLALGLDPQLGSAPESARPAPAPLSRRPRMMLEALLAKLAALGVVAKVGVAAAATGAVVVSAGPAGALPPALQDPFATVAETVTPFDVHDSDEDEDVDDLDEDVDVEESEAPDVEESEAPDVEESEEPDVEESEEPDVEESEEPDVDESEAPEVEESEEPDVEESEESVGSESALDSDTDD